MPHASAQAQHVPRALDITPLGTFGGPFAAVAVDGAQVYAIRGGWLEAYDGRDPANLALEGRVQVTTYGAPVSAGPIAAVGDRIAVALTDRTSGPPPTLWRVFEAQPGRAPVAAGSVRVDDGVIGVAAAAGHLYAVGPAGLRIIDVRDAARPTVVATIADCGAIALRDGRLYLATRPKLPLPRMSRVEVLDVGDPAHPRLLMERSVASNVDALVLYHDRLLAWSELNPYPAGIFVHVLAADPTSLTPVRTIDVGHFFPIGGVRVIGDIAVVGTWDFKSGGRTHYRTFDLTTLPDALREKTGEYETLGYDAAIASLGEMLLVADGARGLLTLGVDATSGVLTRRGGVDTVGSPSGLATDGRYVFTSDSDAEVWVLEASPSGAFEAVAHAPLALPIGPHPGDGEQLGPAAGASLTVAGDRLYIARSQPPGNRSGDGDVVAVDIADPRRPRTLSAWQPTDVPAFGPHGIGAYGPVAVGPHMYVALTSGLIDVDVELRDGYRLPRFYDDPNCGSGQLRQSEADGCRGAGVAVEGDRAFVVRAGEGVQVFDVSEGGGSAAIDAFPDIHARDVAVAGRALLVADGTRGLRVFDRHAGRVTDSFGIFGAHRIALTDDTAFLVGQSLGAADGDAWPSVWAVDVTDPFQPRLRGHVELPRRDAAVVDWNAPPHALRIGDVLVATIPGGGIATYGLADGTTLPASRVMLPNVAAGR